MAKQTILWTVLPFGRFDTGDFAGRRRVSIVPSPRLTPEAANEQMLRAFPEFLDWPQTLAGADFKLAAGPVSTALIPVELGDSALWRRLFDEETPVAGFEFKDMSKANLRSYALRNVLGYLRRHYGRLAVQSTSNHPTLLPWENAHPDLKDMLTDIGTRTRTFTFADRQVEIPLPGFARFFDDRNRQAFEGRLEKTVFSPDGMYRVQIPAIDAAETGTPAPAGEAVRRTLPSDWYNPRPSGPGTPLLPLPDAVLMDQFSSASEYAFYQASRFYHREPPTAQQRAMRRPEFQNLPAPPPVPEFDFHRIIASFGDLPLLMRALGLVIDCALEDDGPLDAAIAAGGGQAKGLMSLEINWRNGHDASDDTTPRTAWNADKDRFYTRPRNIEHERGLLRLERSDDGWGVTNKEAEGLFDIYQVDPDGAALKTVGFTLSAQNLVAKSLSLRQVDGEVTYTTGDKQAVAALRSGGLGVSKHGRAELVVQDTAAAALKNQAVETANGNKVVFFAEDVLRGYRVDVAPVPDEFSPGPWHTLCAREARYRLIGSGELVPLEPDEGYVSGASTTSTASEGVNPDDHYLHESLFRWTGWSLCTPRPGRTLRAKPVEDTELQAEEPTVVTDEAANGNGVAVEFKALKGTLPRLRFGQLYRFRARLVDLAGNSLAFDDTTLGVLEQASDAVGYWRFEPIDPPAMVHRARLSEGESLERMVVRSNYDADPAVYLTTPDFTAAIAQPESLDFEYTDVNERHLVPPKASQQQCEQHGMFDPFFTDPMSIKEGYKIAAREAGTLFDEPPGAQIELITPGPLANIATTVAVPPEPPSPENPVGDRLTGGQYLVHREAALETPYLPDPASAGVALRAQPGHSIPGVGDEMTLGPSCAVRRAPNQELVLMVAHRGDWPHTQGFRVILTERKASLDELPCSETFTDDGAPQWDEEKRTLTLFVAKGRIVRLFYASFAHPALAKTFGVPYWTENDAEQEFVTGMAVMGSNWLLTPFRTLTLVHAVQAPICLPELIKMSVTREVGAQKARINCRLVRLHGPSTGKFEIEAAWHEWVDDITKDGPERIEHKGQLGEIQLPENHQNEFVLSNAVQAQDIDPTRKRARQDEHELGDTRFRLIQYRIRATTRFREYLPPSIYDDTDLVTRLGPVALGNPVSIGAVDDPGAPVLDDANGSNQQSIVTASAPPDDPRVLYVVPTFRWQRSESPGTQTAARNGNGLRVWLDRPWFSSGDGELLGVILFGDGARFTDIDSSMQSLVTQWGMDPLWDTGLPKNRTRVSDFPARIQSEALQLQEQPQGSLVQVVGHRVHWDGTRRLWYCDIELNPGTSYMPFVRLALCRYQPHALGGQKISKIVLAEFTQVLPRRRAVVKREGDKVDVTLRGHVPHAGPMKFPVDSEYADVSFIQGPHETGRNRFELVLQTRDPALDTDLAWSDEDVLASTLAGEDSGGGFGRGINPGGIFAHRAVAAPDSHTVELRAGGEVRLAASLDLDAVTGVSDAEVTAPLFVEPEIWTVSSDLPDFGEKPARLMLREFERYYTDRTVPERKGGATHRRRVIEERLVYAAIFDL